MPSTNNYRITQHVEIPKLNGNQNTRGTEFKPEDSESLMEMIFQFLDEHSPGLSPSNDLPFKQKLPGVIQWRDKVPAGYEPSPIDFRGMKTEYEDPSLDSAPSPTGSVFSDVSSYDDESVESNGPATPPSNPDLIDKKSEKASHINLDIPSRPFSFAWSVNSPAAPSNQRGRPKRYTSRSECALQRSARYDRRKGPNLPGRPVLRNLNTSKPGHYIKSPKTQSATNPSPPQTMLATITNVADIMPAEFLPSTSSTPEEKRKSIANQLRINTQELTPTNTPITTTPAIHSGILRTSQKSPPPHVSASISPRPVLSPTSKIKSNPISIPSRNPLRNFIGNRISPASKYTSPASIRSGSRHDGDDVSPCSYRRPFESPLSRNVDAIISPQRLDSNGVSPLTPPKSNASPIIHYKQNQNQIMSPNLMSPLRQVHAQGTTEADAQLTPAKSAGTDKTDLYGASPIQRPSKKIEPLQPPVEKPSATLSKIDFAPIDFGRKLDFTFAPIDVTKSERGRIDLSFLDEVDISPMSPALSPIPSPILKEFGFEPEFDYEATVRKSAQILAEQAASSKREAAPMSPLHPLLRKMNVGKWFTRGYYAGEKGMHMRMSRNVVNLSRMEWAIEDAKTAMPVLKCFSLTNSLSRKRDFWDVDGTQIFDLQRKTGSTRIAESTRGYELFSVKQASLYSLPHWTVELSGGYNKNSAQWLAKGDDELENVVVNWGGFEVGRISVVPGNMRHTYNVTTAREMNYCIMAALCTVFDDLRTDEGSSF